MGFTKLDDGFFDSSLVAEGPVPVAVFVLLLSKAGADGIARVAMPVIANRLGITREEGARVFEILQQPDPESRSTDHEGRRIERCDGGWKILNYQKYRSKRDPEARREQTREAMRRHRSVSQGEPSVSHGEPMLAQAEAEAEAEERTNERAPARGHSPANPLIAGRRRELEKECLALVTEIASLTGEDPVEVIAHASGYQGASTTKLNPATMSDDRLAHTLRDLRADAAELRKNAPAKLWVDTWHKIEFLKNENWITQTKGLSLEESVLTVQVPTEEHGRWLRVKYVAGLQAALGAIRLRFVTPNPSRPAGTAPGPASSSEGGTTASPSRPNP